MPNELKPCPFCGGEATLVCDSHKTFEPREVRYVRVACTRCHLGTQSYRCQVPDQLGQTIGNKPYKQAVKEVCDLWNRRVDNA